MTRAILVRHGQTTANAAGVLAGRSEVELNDSGIADAERLGRTLADVPLAQVVTSPMRRTVQTAQLLLDARSDAVEVVTDDGLAEMEYGSWTGRPLAELAKDPLWSMVQSHPAAVRFPEGESMAQMSARAVAAVRSRCLDPTDGTADPSTPRNILFVSHGDVIKAVLADALGLHLDTFQRIVVHPASVSVINYVAGRPFVERINDCNGNYDDLVPPAPTEAVPGGSKGR
ncbi:MAG: MSMEG_4193 family putative phosphomutase [Actinobacteria bacterium]|nr:MSMEG_4193 family putative phosphomutase [Actinomycetota bacterium]